MFPCLSTQNVLPGNKIFVQIISSSTYFLSPVCYISARLSSYEVSVVTGDISGAGTDANVYVILFGDKGESGQF